ncbi:MAG: methyltransferase domain-containing protein [Synergistaceae bacterium]|nr:methyltransferase domain-containing protein [Synergistaceae bacterium]
MINPTISWYDKNAGQLALRYDQADTKTLHGLLQKWIPSGANVLEIGCGSGRDAFFLASMGCSVTASDGSDSMLQTARLRLPKNAEGKVSFQHALFPLPDEHPLLGKKFRAITAVAVLMHIPDVDLFPFACQVESLLEDGGIFLCSVSSGERQEKDGRIYVNRESGEVQLLFERLGFRLLARDETEDGLGRNIVWTTMVFSLEGKNAARPILQIESIIKRDRKFTTYKLALLRALCEIGAKTPLVAQWSPGGMVGIPLGLIVEKWIYYYWPLVNSTTMLPQMQGRELKKQIIFRPHLQRLADSFSLSGGFGAFKIAFHSEALSIEQKPLLVETVNLMAKAIVDGPVTYSGGSLTAKDPFFTFSSARSIRTLSSAANLPNALGRVFLRGEIWTELCLLGHLIGESILLRWAELVHEFSEKKVDISTALNHLLVRPESERDVADARALYKSALPLECVWSGKALKASGFDVDHVIPFPLWHNNDLWNLLPADRSIISSKRDKLVTAKTLKEGSERIIHYWKIARREYPERFDSELSLSLIGRLPRQSNWEKVALSAIVETVELLALQRGAERWEPEIPDT